MRYEGRELLFVDRENAGQTFDFTDVSDLNAKKLEVGPRWWGGDKTWIAPQREWRENLPPIELDAGQYTLTMEGQTAVMVSPVCRETGLRVRRTVTVEEDGTVRLSEEIRNETEVPLTRGIWNVTQVNRPCSFYVPAAPKAFRSYHHEDATLPEVKDIIQENQGWVEVHCRQPQLFKCGGHPKEGKVLIRMPLRGRHDVVWLKSFNAVSNGPYAHNSSVEIYNSGTHNYAEIEIHGPLAELKPGEASRLEQQWNFKKI